MTESTGQPIFILSCNRAGSTLLRFIVDTHPQVYCPPELFMGQAAYALTLFLHGLEGQDSYYEKDGKFYPGPALLDPIRDFLGQRLTEHTARRNKRVWCEKTPDNLSHLPLIDLLFPEARHLCLHRHCLDVTTSASRMVEQIPALHRYIVRSQGHVLTGIIQWWNEMTQAMLDFERANPGRSFRLKYEDLVSDPAGVLPSMFHFLGLDWDEHLLGAVFSAEHDRGIEDRNIRFTNKIHTESLGTGSGLALEEVPEEVLAKMRDLLRELGYPEVIAQASRRQRSAAAEISPAWVFETHLRRRLQDQPEMAVAIGSSYKFTVEGPGGGSWLVDLREGPGRIVTGGEDASCTISLASSDLLDISSGALNARKAFREGRLRLEGDINPEALQRLVLLLLLENEPSTVTT